MLSNLAVASVAAEIQGRRESRPTYIDGQKFLDELSESVVKETRKFAWIRYIT